MSQDFCKNDVHEQDQISAQSELLHWYESEQPEFTPPSLLSLVLRKLFRSD